MRATLTVDVTAPELGYELVESAGRVLLELVDMDAGDVVTFRAPGVPELRAFVATLRHAINERYPEDQPPASRPAWESDEPQPAAASTDRARDELELRAGEGSPIDTLATARVVFEGQR